MEFVVWILEEVFGIGCDDATKIMLATHHNGRGSCGAFERAEGGDNPAHADLEARPDAKVVRDGLGAFERPGL